MDIKTIFVGLLTFSTILLWEVLTPAIRILAILGTVAAVYLLFFREPETESAAKTKVTTNVIPNKSNWVTRITKLKENPICINIFWWKPLARPLLCLAGGIIIMIIITLLLLLVNLLFGLSVISILDLEIFSHVVLLFAIYFNLNDPIDEEVPGSYGALITFWGYYLNIYRMEGIYSWTGQRLGLGRSTIKHELGTDDAGFIKMDKMTLSIWNNSGETDIIRIETLGSDNSTVFATLSRVFILTNPILWLKSDDPLRHFANHSRETFRKAVAFFIAKDCTQLKDVLSGLMQGSSVLTAFLPKANFNHKEGTMLQKRGGAPLYKLIPYGTSQAEISKITKEFISNAAIEADPELYEGCLIKGSLHTSLKTVEQSIIKLKKNLGVEMVESIVSNVSLSKIVTAAADKAASEHYDRKAQVDSAETLKKAATLTQQAKDGSSDFVLGIAAAQDNSNVKTVVIGGGSGSSVKDAAILHATLTDKGDKE